VWRPAVVSAAAIYRWQALVVRQSRAMGISGLSIVIRGEVRSAEDLTIEGRVEGAVHCEEFAVVVAATGSVLGDIVARDITILGKVEGQMVATDIVDVRSGAVVTGQVVSRNFILNDGANFVGRVEPQHLEAALRVAKFQQRRKDTA
jgi:cytoskeletal protein CcmA (bactofilin family)